MLEFFVDLACYMLIEACWFQVLFYPRSADYCCLPIKFTCFLEKIIYVVGFVRANISFDIVGLSGNMLVF